LTADEEQHNVRTSKRGTWQSIITEQWLLLMILIQKLHNLGGARGMKKALMGSERVVKMIIVILILIDMAGGRRRYWPSSSRSTTAWQQHGQ